MGTHKPAHLVRRGNVFYFRAAIPSKLQSVFVRREFKVSLRTTDAEHARLKQRWASCFWEELIQFIAIMPKLKISNLDGLVRAFFTDLLEDRTLIAVEGPKESGFDRKAEIEDAETRARDMRDRVGSRAYDQLDLIETRDFLKNGKFDPIPEKGDLFDDLCNKLLRARTEVTRIYAAILRGHHDQSIPKDPLFAYTGNQRLVIQGKAETIQATVGDLGKKYIDEGASIWASKTVLDNRRVVGWFTQLVDAETSITEITPEMIRQFRGFLPSFEGP